MAMADSELETVESRLAIAESQLATVNNRLAITKSRPATMKSQVAMTESQVATVDTRLEPVTTPPERPDISVGKAKIRLDKESARAEPDPASLETNLN